MRSAVLSRRVVNPGKPKNRQNLSSGVKYEGIVGYSRAVRIGNQIFVSGTTGVNFESRSTSQSSAYLQAKKSIEKIAEALGKLGGSLADVVRTRVFIRSEGDWKGVAKAHRQAFGDVKPASTMIVVGFLDSRILVEIEADAVLVG